MISPIFTKAEADKILKSRTDLVRISLDLGKTLSDVAIRAGFVLFGSQKVPIELLKSVKDEACYVFEDNIVKKVYLFSDETNFYYKLMPTSDWPTITLSSTPMHRHIRISPKQDTETKIEEISPVLGNVLDTCCGLGYTAILAAKSAKAVYTFERDPNVLRIAEYNPYSDGLFNDRRINLSKEDVFDGIEHFEDGYFDRVVHDPPTFKYSPELYSLQFYSKLFRVMKLGGILYHYCPAPHKLKNQIFYKKILDRLRTAGFSNLEYHEKSSGIRAVKQ